jgi:CRP-like cAMP-binding protein
MLTAPEIRASQDDFDPKAFLDRPGPGRATERYGKNQKIFSQGDVADTVFFIHRGKVKVTVLSEHGKEAVVGIFAEGQFFGEAGLEGAAIRTTTSHAMEDCLITSITKQAMLAALTSEPKFATFFIAYLLSRNSRIEDDLIDQLFNSSERRLAPAAAARQFRRGWRRTADRDQSQSGNTGGNDRHHPIPRQFLHEPIQEEGIYRLQRQDRGSSFAARRGVARKDANQRRRVVPFSGEDTMAMGLARRRAPES